MKKSNKLTTSAIFAAILALTIALGAVPYGFVALFLATPVTAAVLAIRVGVRYSMLAGGVACILAGMLAAPATALASVPFVAMGIIIGYRLGMGDDLLYTSLYAAMSSAVTLAIFVIAVNFMGLVSAADIVETVRLSLQMSLAASGMSVAPEVFSTIIEVFIMLLPSGIVFFHFLAALVAAQISGSIARRIGLPNNARTFGELILSPQAMNFTVVMIIMISILVIMGVNHPFFANINTLTLYIAGAAGIAGILGLVFSQNRNKALILGLALLGHFVLGSAVFYLYAILDSRYDFRGIRSNNRRVL